MDWNGEKVALPKKEPEFYNLAEDPAEENDLSIKQPERVSAMKARLLDLLEKAHSK